MGILDFGIWGFHTLVNLLLLSSFTHYFSELTHLNQLASEGHNAYLLGEISTMGWWYYHLVVFFIKTPIPVLILFVLGVLRIAYSVTPYALRNTHYVFLLFPTLLYFLAASLTSLNVGYRYLLPILPLVHIIASSVVRSWKLEVGNLKLGFWKLGFGVWNLFIVSLFIVHLISTFASAPNFLSYFNEFVGANGYKVLSDANIDWAQDLPALGKYLNGRKV